METEPQILAIDVVLLPDPEARQAIIQFNRTLEQPGDKQIHLGESSSIPHLSLLMGGLKSQDLAMVTHQLGHIADQYEPLTLTTKDISKRTATLSVEFEPDKALNSLHEKIVNNLKDTVQNEVNSRHVLGSHVDESTVKWINNYLKTNVLSNFWPHITLGYTLNDVGSKLPEKMVCDQLAIFQLGNHCTCQKLLSTFKL